MAPMRQKQTWELNADERLALARERLTAIEDHFLSKGVKPLRDPVSNALNVPAMENVFVIAVARDDPRLLSIQLRFEAPSDDIERYLYAAYAASQKTIVAKVRIEPIGSKIGFAVAAEFFTDSMDDLSTVLGLYMAAVKDTLDAFIVAVCADDPLTT